MKTYKYTALVTTIDGIRHVRNMDGTTARLPVFFGEHGECTADYYTDNDRFIHNLVKASIAGAYEVGFDFVTRAKYDSDEKINLCTGEVECN